MLGVHHSAICTTDVERSLRFWRDGLGLRELFDHHFTGDWPELFGAKTDRLRSIFLGDPQITVPAPPGKTVPMAVITAPDGVLVELIGPAQ